jgi:hypothetical protein
VSSSSQTNPPEYAVLLSNGDIHWPTPIRSDAAVIAGTYPDTTLVQRADSASQWTEAAHPAPCRWPSSPDCICGGAA